MNSMPNLPRRRLGPSDIEVAPVALGCWPIAGVSTLDVNDANSLATIRHCFDLGINLLDTAYVYGPHGESENLIRRAIGDRRDEVVLATKCGIHFAGEEMVTDGSPARIADECDESLQRLGTDHVELMYLHSPDPDVPIEESAGAIGRLIEAGKVRLAGVSNASPDQLAAFADVCPIAAVQVPYNMLQRDIEERIVPWCRDRGVAVVVYWVLMKGLLAGKLGRDHQFDPRDKRQTYPMYQGEEWERNQQFLDRLREIAGRRGCSVAQLVVRWTIEQPGITVALCGAKRPEQIEETAAAMHTPLTEEDRSAIDAAIADRGEAAVKRVVS